MPSASRPARIRPGQPREPHLVARHVLHVLRQHRRPAALGGRPLSRGESRHRYPAPLADTSTEATGVIEWAVTVADPASEPPGSAAATSEERVGGRPDDVLRGEHPPQQLRATDTLGRAPGDVTLGQRDHDSLDGDQPKHGPALGGRQAAIEATELLNRSSGHRESCYASVKPH
jgi:hypothetical protein